MQTDSAANQNPTDAPEHPLWHGVSHSPGHTHAIGGALATHLTPGDILALTGDLGAGKTHLTRGIAAGLGIDPAHVTSPTFVLMHEYTAPPPHPKLIHIDAYRLDNLDDLASIGWELAAGPNTPNHHSEHNPLGDLAANAVVVIEWADRITAQLPAPHLHITLDHHAEQERTITMTTPAPQLAQRLNQLSAKLDSVLKTPLPSGQRPGER